MYTPGIYRYQKILISQFRPGTSFGPKISWLVTYNLASMHVNIITYTMYNGYKLDLGQQENYI